MLLQLRLLPVLTVALALCGWRAVYALDPARDVSQYVHDAWVSEQGFPGGSVHAIAQTPDGYLWLGTERGLVRFDGVAFRLIQPVVNGQRSQRAVLGLTADTDGNLWVRLAGPTLLRYRANTFAAPQSIPAEALVTATARGRDGRLLASSMTAGLVRERGDRIDVVAAPAALPKSAVTSIVDTASGDVWLGTRDAGLVRIKDNRASSIVDGLPDKKINTLLPDEHDALWVGTDKGIVRWTGTTITSAGVPHALAGVPALTMVRDRDGNVWIGTDSGAVVRVSGGLVSELPSGSEQSRGAVTALFEDRDGNLWIGSARGLERVRESAFVTYGRSQGLRGDGGGPIHVDGDGRLWYAAREGGVGFLERGKAGRIDDRVLARDVVYSIAGRGRDIWFGRQRGGLTRFRPIGGEWSVVTYTQANGLAQNTVHAVHEARDGAVWAGTASGGVSVFRDGGFVTYTTGEGLASNSVTSIADAPDGTVWFGTANGVSSFRDGQWHNFTTGLPSNEVTCLEIDKDGLVWIGTAGGLAVLRDGNVLTPQQRLLPQDPVVGIAADSTDSIWIVSLTRVLRVARSHLLQGELSDSDVREYDLADGLRSTDGVRRFRSVVTDAGGRVWISLAHGLSMTNPSRRAPVAPVLAHVESVLADGKPIALEDPMSIPAGHQRLTFAYTGLSLAIPERVRFRYRLDGFDRDWSEPVATREAAYTNLRPGSYRFRVVASNSQGEWNPAEAAINVRIAPRVWQTTWFQLGSIVALVIGAAGLYRLRMHQLSRRLNVRFEERLAERARIAQDMHDTLLEGVVSASEQLHVAADQVAPDSPAKSALDRVLQLMGRVIDEGHNAVRGLRAPAAGADDLERSLWGAVADLGVEDRVDIRVVMEGRPRSLRPAIRDEVYRIGREAIANAARRSNAQSIEVELAYAAEHLRVLVRDNGSGLDEQALDRGRNVGGGLSAMRERAEQIGATFRILSRDGGGTEVELVVPARIAFGDEND